MTDYWVDPLDGASANSGLTYTDALGSFKHIFDGSLSGGITGGDTVFLMATTGDDINTTLYAPLPSNQHPFNGFEGTTMNWRQLRAVNPTTLQEDGTKYIIGGRNNQYSTFMYGNWAGFLFCNIEIVGFVHSYTSGSNGSIFSHCIFSDGHPLFPNYTLPIRSFYVANQLHTFNECLFINRGYNSIHARAVYFGGNAYGTNQSFTNCEFRNFSAYAFETSICNVLHNCRFINNGTAISGAGGSGRYTNMHITNCFFENNGTDIEWERMSAGVGLIPNSKTVLSNVHNNCQGYNIVWGGANPVVRITSWRGAGDRSTFKSHIQGNIYQNSTSGYSDTVLAGTTYEQLGWNTQDRGWTSGVFGTTFDTGGVTGATRIMVGTADAHNFKVSNIGVFIDNLTEAIVTGNTAPEFGDMF